MNKFSTIFLFFFLSGITSFSQQIIRASLSSFGNVAFENGNAYRQTVGQASNTFVFSNSGIVLRQGFQQPVKSTISAISSKECTLHLNPNPTSDFVMLDFSEDIGEYQISVFAMNGKLLFRKISASSYQIDIRKIPNGVYLLNVVSNSGYHCNEKLVILL